MSHREKEKTEVYYIQSNESHGGTVGAQSNGGYLPVLFEILCPKHLPQRMSRICKLHLCRSLCHWHLPDIALFSFHSVPPCALLCKSLDYHSIFRKFQKSIFVWLTIFSYSCQDRDEHTCFFCYKAKWVVSITLLGRSWQRVQLSERLLLERQIKVFVLKTLSTFRTNCIFFFVLKVILRFIKV